jgi:hypothetical protein
MPVRNWLFFLCFLFLSHLALAQSYVPCWLADGNRLSEEQLRPYLASMQKQQAAPDHIVVLVHGYHTVREESASQFEEVAARLRSQFGKRQEKLLVIGLQWESAVAGAELPWEAEDAYLRMVSRARNVGHQAGRQLLLRVQKQYPKAHLNILGHSLGCEVAAACLLPEMVYGDDLDKSAAFEPKQDLFFNLVGLCGSDLDYDVWYKSHITFRSKKARTRLLWMTISPYLGERDRTLQVRKVSRGRAGGAAFPRMTEQQCDVVFKNRAIVFDNTEIPRDHALLSYFSEERLERLSTTMVYLSDSKAPKPVELAEADQVLQLPARVEVISPYLDSPLLTTQMYALWRLEHMLCAGCKHLCDETMDQVALLLRNTPIRVRKERADSACKVIQSGLWPTEQQLERAGAPSWE